MDSTKALIDRCKRLASNRETISFDAYGAKKALRLLNEMSDALTEVTALAEQGEVAQPAADLEDAIMACERGDTIYDVLANYRAIRRTIQAIRAASPNGIASQEPFPQPDRNRAGKEPCGECHVRPGETCDICGASQEKGSGK